MFAWLDRIFRNSEVETQRSLFDIVDELNAEAGGGSPQLSDKVLGRLKIPSRTVVLGDPMMLPSVEVPGFTCDEVEIAAKLRRYPSGSGTVASLTISAIEYVLADSRRQVGELPIDSAKTVVVDKSDFETHWAEVGKDRVGFISTVRDKRVLRRLQRRFRFKVRRLNGIHSEVVGPVSVEMEQEIERYLETFPEYADYPFFHFRVETNNSFERVNSLETAWEFLPVGNCDDPTMFACQTGYGDGTYEVFCEYAGDTPQTIRVEFVGTDDSAVV